MQRYFKQMVWCIAFVCSLAIALRAQGQCGVIFSEYVESTAQDKGLEIYNPGPNAINLSPGGSNYVVQIYLNGSGTPSTNISLNGTVEANSTFVLVGSLSVSSLRDLANQINTNGMSFTGDDAIVLRRGGTNGPIVDSIGQVGTDPGDAWTNNGVSTKDHTLRRNASVTTGDTNASDAYNPSIEWTSYADKTFNGIGSHANDCSASPPVLNAIGAQSVGLGSNLQFYVTATPTDGDAVTLTASNLPDGAYFYPTNEVGSFLWTNASPTGTYNVTFNAADKDGADEEEVSITVNPAAATPPVLQEIGAKYVGFGSNLQFYVAATPTDGDTVTLTASNLPDGAYFYPTNEAGSFLWTNASPTGAYFVTFNAADKDGADAEEVSITVNPPGTGTLTIVDAGGPGSGASPAGVTFYTEQNCSNPNEFIGIGSTQYQSAGWAGSGSAPVSGTTTSTGPFTITEDSSVTWLWVTNYWLDTGAGSHGSVDVTDFWAAFGSNVLINATPDAYYDFDTWTGDAPAGEETNAAITVVMDGPRQVTASFAERLAAHDVPEWWLASYGWTNNFDDAALGDPDEDTMPTWQEYIAGTHPTNGESVLRAGTQPETGDGPLVTWSSVAGRSYDVEVRTNAALGDWAPCETNVAADPPLNVYTGSLDEAEQLLYRVRVRP